MQVEIIVPIAFFACVAAIGVLVLVGYSRHTAQRHQTLRAMVEKGMQIPPELLGSAKRPPNPGSDRRRGILLICAGIGIGLFLLLAGGEEGAPLGLVPILIGIGYLIVARLDSRKDRPVPVTDEALAR